VRKHFAGLRNGNELTRRCLRLVTTKRHGAIETSIDLKCDFFGNSPAASLIMPIRSPFVLWCLWMGLLALGRPLGGGAESETGLCEWPPEFPSPQAPSDDPLSAHLTGAAADGYQLGRHGLAIVEDACQALGARHSDGTPVGGRGNPAVFGFYANKQITTGEGGMIAFGRSGNEGAGRM
jgi:hypothetical protein